MKRQKKAKKLIKKATVRNSISYTVFFINRTVTDGPTALDCLKQMTKVIKSYGGSSLPTGHKRPLIYNLSGCVWLKAAGIPLRLAVLKVSICTLQRLTISVGRSRNIWQFDPFKRCPNEKIFSHLLMSQETCKNWTRFLTFGFSCAVDTLKFNILSIYISQFAF